MGNSNSNNRDRDSDGVLKFDRILDATNEVYIGIGNQLPDTTKSLQVIRIGDYRTKYNRLIHFVEKENELNYLFENNISMKLEKIGDEIHMDISGVNNKKTITKKIDPFIKKYFKTIGLSNTSDELDRIHYLFTK